MFLAVLLAACGGGRADPPSTKEYVLTTALENGTPVFLGVGDEINGVVNPELSAEAGQTITITLVNGGDGEHQVVISGIKARSSIVDEKGESASVTFKVPESLAEMEYMDGNPAYEALGMRGVLKIQKPPAMSSTQKLAMTAFQKGGCAACHTIPGVPGAVGMIGPDLSEIGTVVQTQLDKGEYTGEAKTKEEYLLEAIQSPDAFISPACSLGPCPKGTMPSMAALLNPEELNAAVKYLSVLPDGLDALLTESGTDESEAAALTGEPPELTDEEFAWAKQTSSSGARAVMGRFAKARRGRR